MEEVRSKEMGLQNENKEGTFCSLATYFSHISSYLIKGFPILTFFASHVSRLASPFFTSKVDCIKLLA